MRTVYALLLAGACAPKPVPELQIAPEYVTGGVAVAPVAPSAASAGNAENIGVPTVHFTDVMYKVRVVPQFPKGVEGIESAKCVAHIVVDTKGNPTSVVVRDCPEPFVQAATVAMQKWRWYPNKVAGVPRSVQFNMVVIFRQDLPGG